MAKVEMRAAAPNRWIAARAAKPPMADALVKADAYLSTQPTEHKLAETAVAKAAS